MNLVTFIAIAILAVGILFGQRQSGKEESDVSPGEQVLSQETDTSSKDTLSEASVYDIQNESGSEVSEPKTQSPTSTPSQNRRNISLEEYIYPNSQIADKSSFSISLKSSDSPDSITDWYKEKIRQKGLSVTTFVVTKTNDSILNKLVGASQDVQVSIEIQKHSEDNTVTIEVFIE